ncbi:hypothetical protein MBLNU457_6647t1 [Dothideomycetes sp. NU457]
MPEDDAQQRQTGPVDQPSTTAPATSRGRDWKNAFRLPKPLKELFEKFPLVTYAPNSDPLRAPSSRNKHTLYVFTSDEGAINGAPSFNPSCLKWQAYLKFQNIDFQTVSSNNHASPSGVLPFLLPAHSSSSEPAKPIASNKIERWAKGDNEDGKANIRAVTHLALINHNLRRAWLYQLYIQPHNFASVAERLYVDPISSNMFVKAATSHHLQSAALEELKKTTPKVVEEDILRDGREALQALSTILGSDQWFFGAEGPALFDASVFAYTHLLLHGGMGWKENELGDALRGCANLVQHSEKILDQYF